MKMQFHFLLLAAFCLSLTNAASAQFGDGIPDERVLNQYGLTLSWWGRAVIDGNRDRVLHLTADEQSVYLQSTSGIISAFSGESGRKLWSGLVGAPDQRGFPASSNDEELLIASGLQLYSFDKNSGELLWNLRSPQPPSASPSMNDDYVAIGCIDGSVYLFDIRKVRDLHEKNLLPGWSHMSQVWRYKSPLRIVSPPVFSGPAITFASEQGSVVGLSTENKKFKFQFESDTTIHTALGSSADYLFVTSDDSRVYCLNKETGRVRWRFSSGAVMNQQAVSVGGQVYVIPNREGLFALSIVSGRALWNQVRATEFIAASDTRVYASDVSGNLLILDRSNGKIIGQLNLRQFTNRVKNDRTDRIYLTDDSGLIVSLKEMNSEFPTFHRFPERRPILPLMGEDEGESSDSDNVSDPGSDDADNTGF